MGDNQDSGRDSAQTYIPGEYYNASEPVTLEEFNSDDLFAKTIPVEPGFIKDPTLAFNVIILVNLTGESIIANVGKPNPRGKDLAGDTRENSLDLVSFELPKGQSSHANVDPDSTIVNITVDTSTVTGAKKPLTGVGYNLSDLEDIVISIRDTYPDGIRFIQTNSANLENFAIIENKSKYPAIVSIKRLNSVFGPDPEQCRLQKQSRLPDVGTEEKIQRDLAVDTELHLDSPVAQYTVRALQTTTQSDTGPEGIYFASTGNIPSIGDYVEHKDARTRAHGGQAVIFLKSRDNTKVISAVYNVELLKFVSLQIVQTE